MAEVSYFTKEGLEKLKEELQRLKTTGRSDISKQIAEARDKGDLSENAEYDAAKEAQGLHEAKISQMQEVSQRAFTGRIETGYIKSIGVIYRKNKKLKNGATMSYQLVAESEADMKAGKISVASPIAKGLVR
jgi:transcription elongation factor GreA